VNKGLGWNVDRYGDEMVIVRDIGRYEDGSQMRRNMAKVLEGEVGYKARATCSM
jgi:hypothetical protein